MEYNHFFVYDKHYNQLDSPFTHREEDWPSTVQQSFTHWWIPVFTKCMKLAITCFYKTLSMLIHICI